MDYAIELLLYLNCATDRRFEYGEIFGWTVKLFDYHFANSSRQNYPFYAL